MLITSGIMAHVCCVAALLVPPHIICKDTEKVESKSNSKNAGSDTETDSSVKTSVKLKAIFGNTYFILVCLVVCTLLFSSSVGFTHLIAFAESEGLSSHWTNMLETMAGLGSVGKQLYELTDKINRGSRKGSGTLLVRLYKDARTPENECSVTKF